MATASFNSTFSSSTARREALLKAPWMELIRSGILSPLRALLATYADTISAVNDVRSSSLLSIFLLHALRGHRTKIWIDAPVFADYVYRVFRTYNSKR